MKNNLFYSDNRSKAGIEVQIGPQAERLMTKWIATLHPIIWLFWTGKCGAVVYSSIVSPRLLHHQSDHMEVMTYAHAAPFTKYNGNTADCRLTSRSSRLLYVWFSFMTMESNVARGNACKPDRSNLIKIISEKCVHDVYASIFYHT